MPKYLMITKKRRRDRRIEQPKPMRFTQRDLEIVEAVARYRVLRQDQLQRLFFQTRSATQRVLVRLYDHGFLERQFLPVLYGRSPTLYVLDRGGAALLRAQGRGEAFVQNASRRALKHEFLEHTLAINDFRISVVLASRRTGYALVTWRSEGQLKAEFKRVERTGIRTVSLIPDSYFALDTPHGQAHFFVEVDRGTETSERFKAKVRAYIAYHTSGEFERLYGTRSLRVLTTTSSQRRLENLGAVTGQITEAEGGQGRFLFALASQVTWDNVLTGKVWYVADADEPRTLIAPVTEEG
jgi:hypothetical protein